MANSGVNVKMGVTGVSQFKQNINTAKNSLKTLDAQLALNEKQFQATGDKEAYMQQKTELLKVKLEEQKAVAANAEKALKQMTSQGVDKASKSFQDMQQQLLKAKGDMLDTENAMNGIAEKGEEAANGVDSMNQQLARVNTGISFQNVTEGIDSITSGMEKAAKKAWQMGEAIVKATLGAGSWADELKTTAAQYEISTDDLQRWRKTANIIDTDVDTILTARDKLKKNREKEDKEAMGAWAYLGIDPNTFQNQEDLFWATGEAIAALGKDEDKVSYATKLFGKSWRELLPLFSTGREEYDKLNESWSIVEEDQIDGLGKMDDAYQKMQSEWETFKNELLSAFSGPLTEGMDTITELFKELNNYLDTPEGKAMLQQMGETISSLISDLTKIDPADVVAGLKSVIAGITDAFKWITKNKDLVVTAMSGIVAGWAALKLTGGALKILEVVNGLKWLKVNPNIPLPGTSGGGDSQNVLQKVGSAAGNAASTFGMAGGVGVAAPLAVMGLAGYAGWKMIEANMNDPLTNKIYGDSEGKDLLDRLTESQLRLAMDYEKQFTENYGSDEAIDARQALFDALEQGGFEMTEDAVQFLEDIWDERERGMDIDGLVAKYEKLTDDFLGGSASQKQSSSEMTAAASTLQGMPAQVYDAILKGMADVKIYIDGQQAGSALTPYVNTAMAGALMAVAVR